MGTKPSGASTKFSFLSGKDTLSGRATKKAFFAASLSGSLRTHLLRLNVIDTKHNSDVLEQC